MCLTLVNQVTYTERVFNMLRLLEVSKVYYHISVHWDYNSGLPMAKFLPLYVTCLEKLLLNFYISSMWATLKTISKIDKSYEVDTTS